MKKNKLKESASEGSTSSGNIASVASGFNFPLQKRLPPSNIFGYKEYKIKDDKESKK